MGEFADKNKKVAAETLRQLFQQEVAPEMDPVVELVGYLLEDGTGGVTALPGCPITTEQWLAWNRLALQLPQRLSQVVALVIKQECLAVPTEQTMLRPWAASILLCTLDRFERM